MMYCTKDEEHVPNQERKAPEIPFQEGLIVGEQKDDDQKDPAILHG